MNVTLLDVIEHTDLNDFSSHLQPDFEDTITMRYHIFNEDFVSEIVKRFRHDLMVGQLDSISLFLFVSQRKKMDFLRLLLIKFIIFSLVLLVYFCFVNGG